MAIKVKKHGWRKGQRYEVKCYQCNSELEFMGSDVIVPPHDSYGRMIDHQSYLCGDPYLVCPVCGSTIGFNRAKELPAKGLDGQTVNEEAYK